MSAKKKITNHLIPDIHNLTSYTTVRLILGDQLNPRHSWFKTSNDHTLYLIAELTQEATYVKHHIQKLCAFFAAMENFAVYLSEQNHCVLYLSLDGSAHFKSLNALINQVMKATGAKHFEYQLPDEYRLRKQLEDLKIETPSSKNHHSTEHFLVEDNGLSNYFQAGKIQRMENFYRKMRIQHNVLIDESGKPEGGQWNYDKDNRAKLKKQDIKDIPDPLIFKNDVREILMRIKKYKIPYFGEEKAVLPWPVNLAQSQELLDYFIHVGLSNFGKFQDAMTCSSPHAWSLYHSRLSFSINSKMLHPKQVIKAAIKAYRNSPDQISIAQIEGFVRQIMGWREFVRGVYWANMPTYAEQNFLNAKRNLPDYFWTGKTNMRCLSECIGQSLEHAYAHHIQRLMVIGNFCLITEIDPDQVDAWYLGVYIDAIEWVEMPNVRGMSLYADGGIFASKPYSASGNYINKMSDYCSSCQYNIKETIGKNACPLNSLYWRFMVMHKDKFGKNPRINMLFNTWEKKSENDKNNILDTAKNNLIRIQEI